MQSSSDPMLRVKAERLGLFETPVIHGQVADVAALNAELAEAIARERAQSDTIGRSNVGGWHSKTDMMQWGGAAATRISDAAIRLAKRMSHFDERDAAGIRWSVRMWANVSPPGALNMSHAHPGVLWAAVYYVNPGSEPSDPPGGELFLEDPRFPLPYLTMPGFRAMGGDGQPQPTEKLISPRAGDLVLFPGYLRHGVRPHRGSRERISVAMNLYAKES